MRAQDPGAPNSASRRRDPRPWHHNYLALRLNRRVIGQAQRLVRAASPRLRVLDAGCGAAPFAVLFPDSQYVACDISADAEAAAVLADNAFLPFLSDTFDLVIGSETLEHTVHVDRAAAELVRVARPGGLVFVSVPYLYPLHGMPYDYQRLTEVKLRTAFESCEILELRGANSIMTTWLVTLEYALTLVCSVNRVIYWFSRIVGTILSTLALGIEVLAVPVARALGHKASPSRAAMVDQILASMPSGYALLARKR